MRPAVYGSQYVFNKKGVFVGCNLGYNFYFEHEQGTLEMVRSMNIDHSYVGDSIKSSGLTGFKAMSKYKKVLKEEAKILKRWENTPFNDYVLSPNVPVLVKNITINNESISCKYSDFLLADDDYILVLVVEGMCFNTWKSRLGKKRIFTEEDLFYMYDYSNDMSKSSGIVLSNHPKQKGSVIRTRRDTNLAGQWGSDGFMLLIRNNKSSFDCSFIAESITDAIKRGCLAVVPQEPRLFNDRGCCLVILDRAYGV